MKMKLNFHSWSSTLRIWAYEAHICHSCLSRKMVCVVCLPVCTFFRTKHFQLSDENWMQSLMEIQRGCYVRRGLRMRSGLISACQGKIKGVDYWKIHTCWHGDDSYLLPQRLPHLFFVVIFLFSFLWIMYQQYGHLHKYSSTNYSY